MTETEPTPDAPQVDALLNRLASCPADFLAEPRIGSSGAVHVAAVVSDLLVAAGRRPLSPQEARAFVSSDRRVDRNRLRLALVVAWLLRAPALCGNVARTEAALRFLTRDVTELAGLGPADTWVQDPERREELVRRCVKALGLRPAGESPAQAEDRLATLDSAGRQRVIAAARQAEERARAVREAMAKKAAYEASLKATRE